MVTIEYGSAVKKDLRKLEISVLRVIEKIFLRLSNDPYLGERLQGELSKYFAYHFKVKQTEYRIIYEFIGNEVVVYIIMIGSRENLYKNLKRRL